MPTIAFPYLEHEYVYTYDGQSSPKYTRTDYTYTAYGNISSITRYSDADDSYTKSYTYREYATNTSAYIVDKVKYEYLQGYNRNNSWTTLRKAYHYYDGSNTSGSVTKGNLTRTQAYYNGSNYVNTYYNYDSYGNRTRMQDPNGNVTNWCYDTIYHAYSIKETNALNQSIQWYYYGINGSSYNTSDRPYGMLEKITDPNGVTVKQMYYDPLQRVTKMIEPGDSSNHPTTKYTYYLDGNAPEYVRTEKCENSGSSGVLTSYVYMDGLGRAIQEKSEAQNSGHYVTVDTYYDSRGLLATKSVPYDTNTANYGRSSSAKYTAYTYDAVRRLTRTTYPDTTTEQRAYNRWQVTVTNPRGKQIITTYYGDGLVKQVQEKNGSSTYTTNYKYNTGVSELAQITGAGLIRSRLIGLPFHLTR